MVLPLPKQEAVPYRPGVVPAYLSVEAPAYPLAEAPACESVVPEYLLAEDLCWSDAVCGWAAGSTYPLGKAYWSGMVYWSE